jgi:hypothetical protein
MMEEIGPIQSRVKEMKEEPQYIVNVLNAGAARCKAITKDLMEEVRKKVGVKSEWMKQ